MAGYFEGLMNRGAMPALVSTWSFTQQRHKVIAENIANMSTPGYKAKRLDYAAFQQTLDKAMEKRGSDPRKPFVIDGPGQFQTDDKGRLVATPTTKPGLNAVRHDGTNMSVEREMSDLAKNAMLHETTVQLIAGRFDAMRKAIRGRA